jgi:hypothetical protein
VTSEINCILVAVPGTAARVGNLQPPSRERFEPTGLVIGRRFIRARKARAISDSP